MPCDQHSAVACPFTSLSAPLLSPQAYGSDLTVTNNFGAGGGEEKVKHALQEAMTRVHVLQKQVSQHRP